MTGRVYTGLGGTKDQESVCTGLDGTKDRESVHGSGRVCTGLGGTKDREIVHGLGWDQGLEGGAAGIGWSILPG